MLGSFFVLADISLSRTLFHGAGYTTVVLLPRQKDVWRNESIAPRTNNFGTAGYWLDRMLDQHKKREKSLFLTGIEVRSSGT
jgi:hypothetical protein